MESLSATLILRRAIVNLVFCLLACLASLTTHLTTKAQDSASLEARLQAVDPALLANEARRRGDPKRGALLFHTSPAGCIKCHSSGQQPSPLGPILADLGKDVTDPYVIESLLYPSRSIRNGYETIKLLMIDGRVMTGMISKEDDEAIFLRNATDLTKEQRVNKLEIEQRSQGTSSMMPEGLVATLRGQRDFFDLAVYVMEVARGGKIRAAELAPSPDELTLDDGSQNLDHAGIIKGLKKKDLEAGEKIYRGLCINCHGADGNQPSLPTARAFTSQRLKFGADPYAMFQTLTFGNGLMAPMSYLSPKERYQVAHYIRESFMKNANPDYEPITDAYLDGLPVGTDNGERRPTGGRNYGPALASQLGRDVTSALTVQLGPTTISHNLHTMDVAGVWQSGFLNLDQTQHVLGRGEGVPLPNGTEIKSLSGWRWGHDGTLDYAKEDLLPRGPLPAKWLDYHGHFLCGNQVVLNYEMDGREIWDVASSMTGSANVRRVLRIGPGDALTLATAASDSSAQNFEGVMPLDAKRPVVREGSAKSSIAVSGDLLKEQLGEFTASYVLGDSQELTWSVDAAHRLVLQIPADTQFRLIEIVCHSANGSAALKEIIESAKQSQNSKPIDPRDLTRGGGLRWPDVLTTIGYLGFETGAYALDTISIPDATPWNSWFRTTALDFFPDGRMVIATYGGDIWIVSGIDDQLMALKWKRFAGGLYEPMGVKVVEGLVYVTCKDRLTRLHDINQDGEADYYESFSADTDVSSWFHAFNFDLQTDSKGNFYYSKCGQSTSYALPGSVIKISPDGKSRDVFATGFRAPNGMGIFPDDRLTVSDNQGNWMPASKVSLVKPGGFYGYVQTHARGELFAPDGGRIDHTKVIPPKTFDHPFIWMPQDFDNSSGGQIWVDDARWGPLSGHMLHTSFGKGWLYYLMLQEVGEANQAAIIKLPHNFSTGIMRGRVNPRDGQVYVTGLDGWNGNGRPGLRDQGIQRIRYTGKPLKMVTDCQVEPDGLQIRFNFPLDSSTASNVDSYRIEQWNYQWRHEYGSDMFHPETGEKRKQSVEVASVQISADGASVKLIIPKIRPVNQLHLRLELKDQTGEPFREEIYWTINQVPEKR